MNKVIVIGHLGQDPQMNQTQSGTQVCNFSVATNEKFKNADGSFTEQTDWHKVVAWKNLAEICGRYLKAGRLVAVEGKLKYRTYENKDGATVNVTEINAFNVEFLGKNDGDDRPASVAPTPAQPAYVPPMPPAGGAVPPPYTPPPPAGQQPIPPQAGYAQPAPVQPVAPVGQPAGQAPPVKDEGYMPF